MSVYPQGRYYFNHYYFNHYYWTYSHPADRQVPLHAWEVRRVGERLERQERAIDDSSIELVLRYIGPGVYGIKWSW